MSSKPSIFSPREGAILDLESLRTLALSPSELVGGWLSAIAPGDSGLVLEGLELVGELSQVGPPGTRRMPDVSAGGWTLGKGVALVTDESGRKHLLKVTEETPIRWPTADGFVTQLFSLQ